MYFCGNKIRGIMDFINFNYTKNIEMEKSYFQINYFVDGAINIRGIFSEKRYTELNLSESNLVLHYDDLIQKKGFKMLRKDRSYYKCQNAKTLLTKIDNQIKNRNL